MAAPTLKPSTHPRYPWVITYWHEGKRKTSYFGLKGDAEAEMRRMTKEHDAGGTAGLVMDAKARSEYFGAKQELERVGCNKGLVEVVRAYIAANPPGNGKLAWKDAVEQFLGAREKRKRSDRTLGNLKNRLAAYAREYCPKTVGDLSETTVEEWIDRRGISSLTSRNDFAALRNFANWLVAKGHLSRSPLEKLESPHIDASMPQVLTLAESDRVLKAAEELGPLRYYAIGLLAGLRQSEIVALPEGAIQKEHIAVVGIGKKRSRTKRVIPVCPRLRKILEATQGSPLVFDSYIHKKLKELAKVTWQEDILRHTWVSYRLAFTGDAARTAMEAGHDSATMARYYVNAKSKAEAEAFFGEPPTAKPPGTQPKTKRARTK